MPINKYLKLSPYEFDQTNKGWRKLDNQDNHLEAAEMIEKYIDKNHKKLQNHSNPSIQTVYFHLGQMYAFAGKSYYKKAVENFKQSFKGKKGWDLYVKGTIEFLNEDKEKLNKTYNKLRKLANDNPELNENAKLLKKFKDNLSIQYKKLYS